MCRHPTVHICHWPRSMTNVHEHCVWFRLSECIFVIDHGQWQICMSSVCDLDSVSAYLSLTRSLRGTHKTCVDTTYYAFVSLTKLHRCHWLLTLYHSQWHAFVSLTKLHWCHWPIPKRLDRIVRWHHFMSLIKSIFVIDHCSMIRMHWVWFTPSYVHWCHWPNCIGVIDHSAQAGDHSIRIP